MNKTPSLLLISILTALLGGCASTGVPPEFARLQEQPLATSAAELAQPAAQPEDDGVQPLLYPGSDRMVNMPSRREPVRLYGDAVSLNFEQTPLREVVHAILGGILELDYSIEQPIQGDVTLVTRSPMPRDQLLIVLESLLHSRGLVLYRDPQDRYRIASQDSINTQLPAFANPNNSGAGFSNVIIPLQYIRASEMAEILRPVASEGSFVRIDNQRNLLILAGTRSQISGWMDIIRTFDIDLLAGMSVGIFPLHNGSVHEVATALGTLLSQTPAGGAASEGGQASSLAGLVRVFPVESLGSLIVVTPRAHYLQQLGEWVARLDEARAQGGEKQLFVYAVQNSNAQHLAHLLDGIFGGDTAGSGQRAAEVAPGSTPARASTQQGEAGKGAAASSGGNIHLGEAVRVVADDQNNALLIHATRSDYRKIEEALRKLDLAPTQVMIEASILEISLTDELQFGLEWALKNNNLGSGYIGRATLSGLGLSTSGFGYTVHDAEGALRGVLNALAERSLVNVISSPSIMVLDNHTATIHVGDQQPVRSAQSMTDGGVISTSITYKDTGVMLSVTPSVNAGGMITMSVKQSVTDVGAVDVATNQRSFLERNIDSRVAVRSGESVVLGGLIRDNRSTGRTGVPVLHRLPILGNLFGKTGINNRRTELLVIITPRAIFNDQELRQISEEMRQKMHTLRKSADQL